MDIQQIRDRAFAMPLTNPAYPMGPYRFVNREFLIISYRTDPERLRAVIPAPLEFSDPIVNYEFIRMPDSTGFGDYTESGQVIPVRYQGRVGNYTHAMYLDDHPPLAAGRELWGFPKKLAQPKLHTEIDTLVGTLDYGPVRVATGTMGYKHRTLDAGALVLALVRDAELPAEDHPACRRQRAHLRTGVLPPAGRDREGCLGRAGGLVAGAARAGAGGRAAGARGAGRKTLRGGPDPGLGPGHIRLSCLRQRSTSWI
jgi:hypothetical protein